MLKLLLLICLLLCSQFFIYTLKLAKSKKAPFRVFKNIITYIYFASFLKLFLLTIIILLVLYFYKISPKAITYFSFSICVLVYFYNATTKSLLLRDFRNLFGSKTFSKK